MSTDTVKPKIDESWFNVLKTEFEQPYFANLKAFLLAEKQAQKTIYPPGNLIFNTYNLLPFNQVKVVILGQDPYHGPRQAHGLSFSVQNGIEAPPSLKNIFKEISADLGIQFTGNTDLTPWVKQGVFLLNAMLTVEQGKPLSHQNIGWQRFTDATISALSQHRQGIIFMLWGNFAKSKLALIDANRHHILTAGHPSPLSVRLFLGCQHFSKTNNLLTQQGQSPIDWKL